MELNLIKNIYYKKNKIAPEIIIEETNKSHLETNKSHLETNESHLDTNQSHLDTNQSHLDTNQSVEELKYINNLVNSNDPIIDITASINKKLIDEFGKGIEISMFTIIKDFIRNFRTLNEFQLDNLNKLSEDEKIEIIKLYNNVYKTIETLI